MHVTEPQNADTIHDSWWVQSFHLNISPDRDEPHPRIKRYKVAIPKPAFHTFIIHLNPWMQILAHNIGFRFSAGLGICTLYVRVQSYLPLFTQWLLTPWFRLFQNILVSRNNTAKSLLDSPLVSLVSKYSCVQKHYYKILHLMSFIRWELQLYEVDSNGPKLSSLVDLFGVQIPEVRS